MRMSNAARRFVGDAGEREVRHRVPTEDAALVLRIRKRMDAVIRRLEAWRSASRERNDLTTAIQAPRRYFETSLQYLRSFGIWAIRNFPGSYCSGAQHPHTTPLLVLIRSSSIRVLFSSSYYSRAPNSRTVLQPCTNPQLTISIPLPCSYQSSSA
jgi:hypothetical protein